MARHRTQDLPDLSTLLMPRNAWTIAVEQAVLRRQREAQVAAPLPEQIAAKLAGLIVLDHVHTGQRLLEQDISTALKVSRAPVREALRILERDRLVEFQARRGATVPVPTPKDLSDVFEVRSTLYGMILRHEMEEQPEALRALFDLHIPKIIAAADESIDAYAVASFVLNSEVAAISDNQILADLLQSVSLQTLRYVRLGLGSKPNYIKDNLKGWRQLHKAIIAGDVEKAVVLAQKRISTVHASAATAVKELAASEGDEEKAS
ncbi:GntR family transcriptional regulator [Nocardioides sp. Soil796]|uniref:GntR family transcriptional regulator n=1 Tax=Nocardioides sp. Soil796 TaxID=1736412 RepID=UPI000708D053|nr:GntR family transcriptional regulator [Nocardioides sp. Soil796]KRF10612.1 GntR family transcriptional regulator [Nocardioides sp. Soil796]